MEGGVRTGVRGWSAGACLGSAVADALMTGFSGEVEGPGFAAGGDGRETGGRSAAGGLKRKLAWLRANAKRAAEGPPPEPAINCLIRSTVGGSMTASALVLTSRPHFWIRSMSSWLFSPSSFANSWTRVDNGNSSCRTLRRCVPDWSDRSGLERHPTGRTRVALPLPSCGDDPRLAQESGAEVSGSGRRIGLVDAIGPRRRSALAAVHG